MCTIGCMYLEHVDGRWLRQYRYGQRWRWSSVERPEQQQHLLPAATDPEPPAGMPKGQGRRRKEGGIGTAMHAHAGWQGRLHTGKATTVHTALHRSAPARRASCVLPWDGCRQSLRRAAHPTWPIPSLDQGDVWSLQPCRLGRRAYTTTGPMARRCRRNPAKGVQTGALQARMTAKLRSCLALLYQPCFALPWGPPFWPSVCRASAAPARIIGRRATGCRISRGWLPMRRGLWLERRWQLPR
jgi:hypothetical protein